MIFSVKIATIIGARPQFIKAAMVSRAIGSFNEKTIAPQLTLNEIIIHTGQHFDGNMNQVFFEELEIRQPDFHLGVSGGGHGAMTGVMLEKTEPLLQEIRPDWVLVYGDTNSTLAGALAAAKLHIPLAHVESGLRSHNRKMPEEINRILTDQLSTILFCPTETAVQNLREEGYPHQLSAGTKQQIFNCGDVMFDAALFYGDRAAERSQIMVYHGLKAGQYALATVHRAENTDKPDCLLAIMEGLDAVAQNLPVILPLHPRTRTALERERICPERICLIDPVGYLDMTALEMSAAVIATDSGGVQKEAYFHGVPCVTLRQETEWTELVAADWNRLAPPGKADIKEAILGALGGKGKDIRPYGDGRAADVIVGKLAMQNQTFVSSESDL